MQHIRSLVLPVAIVMGFLFHNICGIFYCIVPYLVFSMLFLNYSAVDVRKMHLSWMHLWLMAAQVGMALGLYLLFVGLGFDRLLAEGLLLGVITPVAASVVVISCALGANRESVTTFTILDNLMVAVVAPIFFSFIGERQELSFLLSFWKIFCRIAPQIVFPFLAALLLQHCMPKVNTFFCRIKGAGLYIWAVTLTIVLGKTFHDIIIAPTPQWGLLSEMSILAVGLCALQFGFGKWIGAKYGEKMAGGQLLGQKNTSFGIWLAVEYLTPMAGVFSALYSVCQNIFNSWQMWRRESR